MMSLNASRGQPRGSEAARRPRRAAGSLPVPLLGGMRTALEPGDQRPQSAGAGRRGPRAPGEMWSGCSPRATLVSECEGLGRESGGGGTKCPRRKSKKQSPTHREYIYKKQVPSV